MKLHEQEVKFSAKKILDYPTFRQATKYTCGVASVQAALIHCFGAKYDIPETSLVNSLKATPSGGVDPTTMASVLKSKGVRIDKRTMTKDDLIKNVDESKPTIICIQAWGDKKDYSHIYKEGHYVTVIGYNDSGFIFEDPSISSKQGFIPFNKLEERWHDVDKNGKKYDHMGIVILCSKKFNPEKMTVIDSKSLVSDYLSFLQETEWDTETDYPESFDLQTHRDMLGKLGGLAKSRHIRHNHQPSLYNVYVRRSLGDYLGRVDSMNAKSVPHIGIDDFREDMENIIRKALHALKMKSEENSDYIASVHGTPDSPDEGEVGEGDGGD
jgi:predicted double-glycine peptidase